MRKLIQSSVFAGALLALSAAPASAATCPNQAAVKVPGAQLQELYCLDDLTTAANTTSGRTDQSDWSALHARGTRNPSGVPGLQVEGYFQDNSTTNTWRGRNRDSQFVIRMPNKWNGKIVITGAPGVRRQYANDFIISDWVLDRGYAFASTDKGNTGTSFYNDGVEPGDAVVEWHRRVNELTRATQAAARQLYGKAAERTYMTGISNGGYLTRYALENSPELYDGGVDWEGTLMRPEPAGNLLSYLPAAIKNYAAWKRGDARAHQAILAAGFEPGSEFLWDYHEAVYWDLTQRIYREEFDPSWDGALSAGVPFCQSGTPNCDADYDYSKRPQAQAAMAKVANTGRIGKPMLTLHGTLDALLPIRPDSNVYTDMVKAAGKGDQHRYYVIDQGTHVDSLVNDHPDKLRPILPCYRAAFLAMERWVERGEAPPPAQFVPRPKTGDTINECTLAGGEAAPGGGTTQQPGGGAVTKPQTYSGPPAAGPGAGNGAGTPSRRAAPRGMAVRVTPRRDRRRPWTFRTTGRLQLPANATAAQACRDGRVSVDVRAGRRTISRRLATLRRDCTFSSRVRFGVARRLGAQRRLRFTVRFLGNSSLSPFRAPSRVVRAR